VLPAQHGLLATPQAGPASPPSTAAASFIAPPSDDASDMAPSEPGGEVPSGVMAGPGPLVSVEASFGPNLSKSNPQPLIASTVSPKTSSKCRTIRHRTPPFVAGPWLTLRFAPSTIVEL
jgi:hypothetical protein